MLTLPKRSKHTAFENWGEAWLRRSSVGTKLSEWRERERAASYHTSAPFSLILYLAILVATQAIALLFLGFFILQNLHKKILIFGVSMLVIPIVAFVWPLTLGLILEKLFKKFKLPIS